jgi:hypothetical protein
MVESKSVVTRQSITLRTLAQGGGGGRSHAE